MKRTILSLIILFFLSQNLFANTVKVIDGDTIKIGNEKIRFGGIDAPELKQICFKNEEKISCGILAKNVLKKKIGKETPKCISEGKDIYKSIEDFGSQFESMLETISKELNINDTL